MKKILCLSFSILTLSMFFTLNAYAYLDPTVVTYIIQAVAGVVIAGGAVFVLLWTRAKKKIAKKLNIDENKNKEVEEDIVINEEQAETEKENTTEEKTEE